MLKHQPAQLYAIRCVLGMLACSIALAANVKAADPDGTRFFQEKIAPVLKAECFRCHSAGSEKLRGGLRLDVREAILEGGDSGPAVVPGKSEESLLIQAIRHEDGLAMPPKKPKLSDQIIADFTRWVDAGTATLRQRKPNLRPPHRSKKPARTGHSSR